MDDALVLCVGSWNVGNAELDAAQLESWLPPEAEYDVVCVALQEAAIHTDDYVAAEAGAFCTLTVVAVANFIFLIILAQVVLLVWEFTVSPSTVEIRDRPAFFIVHIAVIAATVLLIGGWVWLLRKQAWLVRRKRAAARAAAEAMSAVGALRRHLSPCFEFAAAASLDWGQLRLAVFAGRDVAVEAVAHDVVRVGSPAGANRDVGTGLIGNKGALCSRFDVHRGTRRVSLCVTGAHLPAHEGHARDRDVALAAILDRVEAHLGKADVAVFCGDLNYRLDTPLDAAAVAEIIAAGRAEDLAGCDELNRRCAEACEFGGLEGWTLAPAAFDPTFKCLRGAVAGYDTKRKPGWCDRAFYRAKAGGGVEACDVVSATSAPKVTTSDHKPVSLVLRLTLSPSPAGRDGARALL
ncbi:Endonuclease/exonuclease/phosphatase [Pelagophyceae sp. CCMP2097]|nr:Endonuclease/exonuclease/phosphatase [Pelagophyceae sp. CCMP2097]